MALVRNRPAGVVFGQVPGSWEGKSWISGPSLTLAGGPHPEG